MTTAIYGFCDPRFKPLEDTFRANFDEGLELGASLAATWQGRPVVDLWAGWADVAQSRPWEEDTLVGIRSTTKIATAFSVLKALDRGLIELDAPVARYWPDFAQGGKGAVTIRDALTHQAGVPSFAEPIHLEQLTDWDEITARIAAEPHWFGGQRRIAYHSLTFGFELGEVIRRVDGRKPSQFFREEIAGPLGADIHITLTEPAQFERVAEVAFPPGGPPPPSPPPSDPAAALLFRMNAGIGPPRNIGPHIPRQMASAEIPAGSGSANGRSIARICAMAAMRGALDGVACLSPELLEQAASRQAYGHCPYLGPVAFGLGFGLDRPDYRYPSPTTYGWGGLGGSWGVMDPRKGVSLGYAPNNFLLPGRGVIDTRLDRFNTALRAVLAEL